MLAVDFDDVDDVVVHARSGERAAGSRLHGLLQVLVFDLFVALEGEPIDGRVFHDRDKNAFAVARNLDVFKKAGGVEALHRRIERCGIERAVRRGMKLRADHVGIDVPVAGDRDA